MAAADRSHEGPLSWSATSSPGRNLRGRLMTSGFAQPRSKGEDRKDLAGQARVDLCVVLAECDAHTGSAAERDSPCLRPRSMGRRGRLRRRLDEDRRPNPKRRPRRTSVDAAGACRKRLLARWTTMSTIPRRSDDGPGPLVDLPWCRRPANAREMRRVGSDVPRRSGCFRENSWMATSGRPLA